MKRPGPKPIKSSDDTDTSHGLKPEESKTVGIDCGVQQHQQGSSIVQKKVIDEEKDGTLMKRKMVRCNRLDLINLQKRLI
jgi:hypothetical protein